MGDECSMYVLHRQASAELFVHEVWPYPVRRAIRDLTAKIERRLSLQNMLYPPALFYRKHIRQANVLHFQHISHEYLNFMELLMLSRQKAVVLSLHDFSNFTGHCPNPPDGCELWKWGCDPCSDLHSVFGLKRDRAHILWRYKRAIWKKCRMDIVVASRWLLERVNASPLFSHCEKHLIPFGVDLDVFCPGDSGSARKELGIPSDHVVLLFRGLDAPAKGLSYLLQALKRLDESGTPVYLLIVNDSGFFSELKGRFGIKEFGVVTDSKEMARIYQAADIFLSPSLQETFGMMCVEAMACGLACVITRGTPLTEITRGTEAALVVPKRDPMLLADAISRLVADVELRRKLGGRGRELASEIYDFRDYARKMRELYIYTQERRGKSAPH